MADYPETIALILKIAEADLWTESDFGVDEHGSVTFSFCENREAEAQDWIIEARKILGLPERREPNEGTDAPDAPSHWDEDETYPVADWKTEVENDDTRQSYAEWVGSQRELREDDEAEGFL